MAHHTWHIILAYSSSLLFAVFRRAHLEQLGEETSSKEWTIITYSTSPLAIKGCRSKLGAAVENYSDFLWYLRMIHKIMGDAPCLSEICLLGFLRKLLCVTFQDSKKLEFQLALRTSSSKMLLALGKS